MVSPRPAASSFAREARAETFSVASMLQAAKVLAEAVQARAVPSTASDTAARFSCVMGRDYGLKARGFRAAVETIRREGGVEG